MTKKVDEMGAAGAVAGFQVPIGIKKRKKKVDEMIELNELQLAEVIAFFSGLSEDQSSQIEEMLDEAEYVKLAEMIRNGYAENAIRSLVRNKIKEVVRKNASGGFSLYSPNPGKSGKPKKVGDFTTKIAARRVELQRFPPKDPEKLARMRKELERLRKNPKLAVVKTIDKKGKPRRGKKKLFKKESLERMVSSITESLFREEKKGSTWDEYISKLSKQAVLADKTFQEHQKMIAKKSEKALSTSLGMIKKALSDKGFNVNDKGVKKDSDKGITYLEFSVGDEEGAAEVGPFYIVVENGYPKIDVSQTAKNSMAKLDPERGKLMRTELMSIQEDSLDSDETIAAAVEKRDAYLNKMEKKVDDFVADLNSLEITMLKRVLTSKYRKL